MNRKMKTDHLVSPVYLLYLAVLHRNIVVCPGFSIYILMGEGGVVQTVGAKTKPMGLRYRTPFNTTCKDLPGVFVIKPS